MALKGELYMEMKRADAIIGFEEQTPMNQPRVAVALVALGKVIQLTGKVIQEGVGRLRISLSRSRISHRS